MLRITAIAGSLFNRVQLADIAQSHIGFYRLALFALGRRGVGGFSELTPGMDIGRDSGQTVGRTDPPIAGVAR